MAIELTQEQLQAQQDAVKHKIEDLLKTEGWTILPKLQYSPQGIIAVLDLVPIEQ